MKLHEFLKFWEKETLFNNAHKHRIFTFYVQMFMLPWFQNSAFFKLKKEKNKMPSLFMWIVSVSEANIALSLTVNVDCSFIEHHILEPCWFFGSWFATKYAKMKLLIRFRMASQPRQPINSFTLLIILITSRVYPALLG